MDKVEARPRMLIASFEQHGQGEAVMGAPYIGNFRAAGLAVTNKHRVVGSRMCQSVFQISPPNDLFRWPVQGDSDSNCLASCLSQGTREALPWKNCMFYVPAKFCKSLQNPAKGLSSEFVGNEKQARFSSTSCVCPPLQKYFLQISAFLQTKLPRVQARHAATACVP